MAIRKHANNYSSTLNGAINNSTTTIVVTSATGLPAIGAGETYNLTLDDGAGVIEIVTVTDDASTPSLTVTRGAEGTAAVSWADLSVIELRPTADGFDRKADGAASSTDNALPRFDGTGGKVLQGSGVIVDDSNNITGAVSLAVSNTITCSGTGAATIPAGTTAQRPSAANGMIRYNTSLARYEGALGASWSGGTQFLVDGDFSSTGVMTRTAANTYSTFTLGTNVQTFLTTPSSANLRAALTDEVGTGAAYFVGGDLGTPAGGDIRNCDTISFRAYMSTDQSLTNSTYTKVTLDSTSWNTGGYFDTATYKFTPLVAGKYVFILTGYVSGLTDGSKLYLLTYKNGAASLFSGNFLGAAGDPTVTATDVITLNGSTDYVEFYVLQISGGTRTLESGATGASSLVGYRLGA